MSDVTGRVRGVLLFLFAFRGRMERGIYLGFQIVLLPLFVLRALLLPEFHGGMMGPASRWAFLIFGTVAIFAAVSALVRRLHDLNRTGWWAFALPLLAYFLPFLPWAAMAVLALVPGTRGDNRFGPPPCAWRNAMATWKLWGLERDYAEGKTDTAGFNAAREKIVEGIKK